MDKIVKEILDHMKQEVESIKDKPKTSEEYIKIQHKRDAYNDVLNIMANHTVGKLEELFIPKRPVIYQITEHDFDVGLHELGLDEQISYDVRDTLLDMANNSYQLDETTKQTSVNKFIKLNLPLAISKVKSERKGSIK